MVEPDDILESEMETFRKKNSDYSDTWVITGIALSMLHDEPVELRSEQDHIINGNVHRLLDKILRGYHVSVCGNDTNHEAAEDSFEDAAVYCAMIASTLKGEESTNRIEDAYERARDNHTYESE